MDNNDNNDYETTCKIEKENGEYVTAKIYFHQGHGDKHVKIYDANMCYFYQSHFDVKYLEMAKRGELVPKYNYDYDGWFKIQNVTVTLDWYDDIRNALYEMDAEQGNIASIDESIETKQEELKMLQKEIDELTILRGSVLPLYPAKN